jgi:DNA-binding NarL/FixJ family response regulator
MSGLRVVIAEDSAVVREGLALLLADAGYDVIAKVGDADALIEAVEAQQPDIVVADVRMPPTLTDDGARAAEELWRRHPRLPILLLSQHVETTHSVTLAAQGAFGYLLKDRILDVDAFLDAVARVARGGSALDPEVVASLVASWRKGDRMPASPRSSLLPSARWRATSARCSESSG